VALVVALKKLTESYGLAAASAAVARHTAARVLQHRPHRQRGETIVARWSTGSARVGPSAAYVAPGRPAPGIGRTGSRSNINWQPARSRGPPIPARAQVRPRLPLPGRPARGRLCACRSCSSGNGNSYHRESNRSRHARATGTANQLPTATSNTSSTPPARVSASMASPIVNSRCPSSTLSIFRARWKVNRCAAAGATSRRR
jgi:hypothetical protein